MQRVNSALTAISPLDGRYREKLNECSSYVSEYALIRYRVIVELRYLYFFVTSILHKKISKTLIDRIINAFDEKEAEKIKACERVTNHDVKAVEYYLHDVLKQNNIPYGAYVHFGLTSEDINSIAYGLMIKDVRDHVLVPIIVILVRKLSDMALRYKAVPMLARTHGQPAVPTTFGKELMNFVVRIAREKHELTMLPIEAKLTGAVGNFNAHTIAFPNIDWIKKSQSFVHSFGLQSTIMTTQIVPADSMVRIFQSLERMNFLCIGCAEDMWRYISDGYVVLDVKKTEVGSSTMPQKVNPIDFENAEGNLQTANALFRFFAEKFLISRLQRDLSDSVVRRSIGSACAYSVLGYKSLLQGFEKIRPDETVMKRMLMEHWEIVTEGVQTILRMSGDTKAYEKVKNFARGEIVTEASLEAFISSISVSRATQKKLRTITPRSYVGLSVQLVDLAYKDMKTKGDL